MLNHLLPKKQRVVEIDSIGINSIDAVERGPIFSDARHLDLFLNHNAKPTDRAGFGGVGFGWWNGA